MITYDGLAGIPEMAAGMPASVWIAAGILAVLCIVIAVRLYLDRKTPEKKSPDNLDEQFWSGVFFGDDSSDIPERCDENRDKSRSSGSRTSGHSKEHVP
ncbi:MAG: hypothetical protein LUQ31_08135 [Methanoregula sp.]|nr:hypothetical protein [Methanoregula sp.]